MAYTNLGIDLSKKYGFGYDDDYDVTRLPELPEDEKSKWYSKFYYKGRPVLPKETTEIFAKGKPMDPKNALLPGDYDRLMEPGEIENDLGYCLLENGVGYGAAHTIMNGITLEMYDWYKSLRMIDRLSYKIWYPGSHVSEVNGITVEDMGFGVCHFDLITKMDRTELGFTKNPADVDPLYAFIIGGNSVQRNIQYPEIKPIASSLFHYIRILEDGSMDFRTHFFIGGMIFDGKLVQLQRIEPEICLELTRNLCSHCYYERGNVAYILPELYARRDEFDLSAAEGKIGDLTAIR